MAADGKHNREKSKGAFCAVAASSGCGCDIGKDAPTYIEVCKPDWPQDVQFKVKVKGAKAQKRFYEAHHVLCAASVGGLIVDAEGKGVAKIVRETKWCLNTEGNMLAMPLWGHTVQWYCMGKPDKGEPPFADLPQHDWDHTGKGGYKGEVDEELRDLAKELKKAAHEATPINLAQRLKNLSKKYKDLLQNVRGRRGSPKGTHAGWKNGEAHAAGRSKNARWYLPFTMADEANATEKNGFGNVIFNDEMKKKLRWLRRQLR